MRIWMYQQVCATPGLTVPAERVIEAGSAGWQGDSPERPFIVIRGLRHDLPYVAEMASRQRRFQVWYHIEPNRMSKVDMDADLKRIIEWLPTRTPDRSNGFSVTECRCEGISPDLFDDGFRTNTRYAEFLLTGRDQ